MDIFSNIAGLFKKRGVVESLIAFLIFSSCTIVDMPCEMYIRLDPEVLEGLTSACVQTALAAAISSLFRSVHWYCSDQANKQTQSFCQFAAKLGVLEFASSAIAFVCSSAIDVAMDLSPLNDWINNHLHQDKAELLESGLTGLTIATVKTFGFVAFSCCNSIFCHRPPKNKVESDFFAIAKIESDEEAHEFIALHK